MPKTVMVLYQPTDTSAEAYLQGGADLCASSGADRATLHIATRVRSDDPAEPRKSAAFLSGSVRTPDPLPRGVDRVDAYPVDEVLHWDRLPDVSIGSAAPGLQLIVFICRPPHLSAADFRARYLEHADIARVHHPGIARYVQNYVIEAPSGGAPAVDAITEIWFASEDDFRDRFYRDEESKKIVAADVPRFMRPEDAWSLQTTARRIL